MNQPSRPTSQIFIDDSGWLSMKGEMKCGTEEVAITHRIHWVKQKTMFNI